MSALSLINSSMLQASFLWAKLLLSRSYLSLLRDKQSLLRDKQSLLRDKRSLLRDKQSLLCDEQRLLRGKATFLSYEEALLRRRNTYKHQPVNKKRAHHGHKTHPRSCILHAPKRLRDRGNRRRRHHGPDRQQKPVAESCVVIGGPSAGSFEAVSPRLVFRNS